METKVMGNLERISEVAQRCAARWKKRTGKRRPLDARRMAFRKKICRRFRRRRWTASSENSRKQGALSESLRAGGGGCVVLLINRTRGERGEGCCAAGGQLLPMRIGPVGRAG